MNAPATPSAAPIGVVLVHGYLGAPENLGLLTEALVARFGRAAVDDLSLPGHVPGTTPAFVEEDFLAAIGAAIDRQLAAGRALVLIGHSTGGSLLLAEIARRQASEPGALKALCLVVLCATPSRIDLGYAERWAAHTAGHDAALHDVGALVSLVNRLARRAPLALPAPALVVHGEADELVPVADAEHWRDRLLAPQRHVGIAGARHHLFSGDGAAMAVDTICRAVADAARRADAPPQTLFDRMPGLESFCAAWPDSAPHLSASPAGQRAQGRPFAAVPSTSAEPTLANIEITTRCTLGCPACARTQAKLQSRHMSRDDFRRILGQLPHAARVVLVGLGEPLLHPEVIDFIRLAVAGGRRVGLVTNAMQLDAEMAGALCASGLSAITFSLDAVHQATADRVRVGSDMARISANIRGLIAERDRQGVRLGTSAFTALCRETIGEFGAIVDFAADHGLDALMVSDLNFAANQERALNGHLTPEESAGLRAALRQAAARRLPVLSVLGLEEFGLETRPLDYLLLRGEPIAERSPSHRHCFSPWQTIPVNVDGDLTLCDCQPAAHIGNIHRQPLAEWWNGPTMINHRQRMLSDNPPEACLVCPRF